MLGQTFPTQTEFFFIAGADPYFANVQPNPSDPSKQNPPWLSQDLRVFTAVPRVRSGAGADGGICRAAVVPGAAGRADVCREPLVW